MKIKIFLTGGTIDKKYNELTATLEFDQSHIKDILSQSKSENEIDIEQLMLVDSLEIDDEMRKVILKACENEELNNILVTHGTDTMVETAKVLSVVRNKTIVLFGAMRPFSFERSDAEFNLGVALAAVQLLPNGVYIAMNGKIFSWDNVAKNKELGIFEEKNDES